MRGKICAAFLLSLCGCDMLYVELVWTNTREALFLIEPTYISPSLEDYLEVILDLNERHELVRVTDLANNLNVAKSSVNQAVVKLMELNLVRHEKYGPLELTLSGTEEARKIRERHQILRHFFTNVLGVEQKVAEEDACRVEHHISPATMERLLDFLIRMIDPPLSTPGQTKTTIAKRRT